MARRVARRLEQGGRTWQKERARTGLGWRPEKLAPMLMPKRRMKREQPMMHPICRLQQQPQHFLWGCSIPPRVAADNQQAVLRGRRGSLTHVKLVLVAAQATHRYPGKACRYVD